VVEGKLTHPINNPKKPKTKLIIETTNIPNGTFSPLGNTNLCTSTSDYEQGDI
jgi:hypothetical protein